MKKMTLENIFKKIIKFKFIFLSFLLFFFAIFSFYSNFSKKNYLDFKFKINNIQDLKITNKILEETVNYGAEYKLACQISLYRTYFLCSGKINKKNQSLENFKNGLVSVIDKQITIVKNENNEKINYNKLLLELFKKSLDNSKEDLKTALYQKIYSTQELIFEYENYKVNVKDFYNQNTFEIFNPYENKIIKNISNMLFSLLMSLALIMAIPAKNLKITR